MEHPSPASLLHFPLREDARVVAYAQGLFISDSPAEAVLYRPCLFMPSIPPFPVAINCTRVEVAGMAGAIRGKTTRDLSPSHRTAG